MARELDFSELASYFQHAGDYLGHYDAEPLLKRLRDTLVKSVEDNFARQLTPDGIPWLPRKKPAKHKPLNRTGNLLLHAVEAAYYVEIKPDGLFIDTTILPDYGLAHLFGTRTIDARPFIGFGETFADDAEQLFVDDVLNKMLPP